MTAFHSANMMLDYQDIGSGPLTLVLLPGWCEPKTVFEPFIALAAERYRVISIDWRGHGLSSKAAGMSLAADDLLEDVRQLLTALRLDNVITLSVAHASWLAVALAEALPQRVRGMVFLDWIMTQPEPAFFTAVSRMQQPQQWLAGMNAPPPCRHIYSLDRRDDYLRQQQAFAAEQPFFSVVRLGEARTHLGILERPDAVLWAVEDFLAP